MRLRIVVADSKTWGWLEYIGLTVLGLAIFLSVLAIVLVGVRSPSGPTATPGVRQSHPLNHSAPAPVASPVKDTPRAPVPAPQVPAVTARVVTAPAAPARMAKGERPISRPAPEPRSDPDEPRSHRLKGHGPVVVVAVTEQDARDLLQSPEKLGELIQNGSLFSVPNDTAVSVTETHSGVTQVHMLGGAFQGRDGWVRADQVAPVKDAVKP